MPHRISIGQLDGDSSLAEVPCLQVTLVCDKLTKDSQHIIYTYMYIIIVYIYIYNVYIKIEARLCEEKEET